MECVIVNFNTAKLLEDSIKSLKRFYEDVTIYVVDNCSSDNSLETINKLESKFSGIKSSFLCKNIGHGPAMHIALTTMCEEDYVMTLDSDTIVKQGGFIEDMLCKLKESPVNYAIGWLRWVNSCGVSTMEKLTQEEYAKRFNPYIHPFAMMLDRRIYATLPGFSNSGAPCYTNMFEANRNKYKLLDYPIQKYVTHLVAGTRRMYGGKWNPETKEHKDDWDEKKSYPI